MDFFFFVNWQIRGMPKLPGDLQNSPLADRERDICRRFRQIRMSQGMVQKAFADALRIPIERLKSYEHGRAPVKFELADAACAKFNFNQRWLATGAEPISPYVDAVAGWIRLAPAGTLFSAAYDEYLHGPLEDYLRTISQLNNGKFGSLSKLSLIFKAQRKLPKGYSEEGLRAFIFDRHLARMLSATAGRLPSDLLIELCEKLDLFLEAFELEHETEIGRYLAQSEVRGISIKIGGR